MGDSGFEKWLLTIGRLDAVQRQRALRVLALAEAADTGGFLSPCGDDGTAGGRDAAVSPAQLDGGAGAESPFGKIGRCGSRALAARIAVPLRFARGAALVTSCDTAVPRAARRSIR